MTSTITICDTCKRDDWQAGTNVQTDGERLAEMVEAAAAGNPHVTTRRHSCLMGCARGCNVAIQGAGKLAYTLGEFVPSDEAAQAVVDYAALHAQSETGTVPYKQWPQPIKGHFVTRHPPLPDAS
ncbi:MAG: DUF1636 domain-containing protein [Litoreibacter sp.]|nr:DUF1636 domain-containing protein [Litoreibacter sp.]